MAAYSDWTRWAEKFKLQVLPAIPTSIALCILNKIQIGKSFASIRSFFYGIKFTHVSQGFQDPTNHHLVRSMLEAAHRICEKTVRKKEPITVEHIKSLHSVLLGDTMSLSSYRIFIIILLSYFGFLRYSEVTNIRRCDLILHESFFKIFIQKSKCDVYRDGKWLYICASVDSMYCPLEHIKGYFQMANITDPYSEEFIIRAISPLKKTQTAKLRACNKPLSYTTARELFLKSLKLIGVKPQKFGLHSMRS